MTDLEKAGLYTALGAAITAFFNQLFGWWKYRKGADSKTEDKTVELTLTDRQKLTEEMRKRIASLEIAMGNQAAAWEARLDEQRKAADLRDQAADERASRLREATFEVEKQLIVQSRMVLELQAQLTEMRTRYNEVTVERNKLAEKVNFLQERVDVLEGRRQS